MRSVVAFFLLFTVTLSLAATPEVRGFRVAQQPYGSQLILAISAPVKHSSFLLDNPPRLVVNIENARLSPEFRDPDLLSPEVRGVHTGVREGAALRIVVDLVRLMHGEIYVLKTAEADYRLLMDLYRDQRPAPGSVRPADPTVASNKATDPVARPAALNPSTNVRPVKQTRPVRRELVIAIDPGHGGKDSGAIGPRNNQEKDVVLQIARRLQRLVNREPRMRAVLTRNNDTYLRLYERIDIARKQKADLFISLHADACEACDASGSSVFILSTKGASSAAAHWLAKRENESDLIGGGKLANVAEDLAPVVFDIVHDAVLAESMRFADLALDNLNRVGDVHRGHVERAGFAVLKAPDIPSALVETAFISNPEEELKLVNPRYQEKLAQAILNGIRAYFRQRPLQEVMIAEVPSTIPSEATKPVIAEAPASVLPLAKPVSQAPATTSSAVGETTVVAAASADPALPTAKSVPVATSASQRLTPLAAYQVHVIQRGESLADIAQRYRISLSSLRSANGLGSNQLRMPAGTPLTIPAHDS